MSTSVWVSTPDGDGGAQPCSAEKYVSITGSRRHSVWRAQMWMILLLFGLHCSFLRTMWAMKAGSYVYMYYLGQIPSESKLFNVGCICSTAVLTAFMTSTRSIYCLLWLPNSFSMTTLRLLPSAVFPFYPCSQNGKWLWNTAMLHLCRHKQMLSVTGWRNW